MLNHQTCRRNALPVRATKWMQHFFLYSMKMIALTLKVKILEIQHNSGTIHTTWPTHELKKEEKIRHHAKQPIFSALWLCVLLVCYVPFIVWAHRNKTRTTGTAPTLTIMHTHEPHEAVSKHVHDGKKNHVTIQMNPHKLLWGRSSQRVR